MNLFSVIATVIVITNDHGGSIYDYYSQVQQYEKSRTKIEIDGFCASACTMYLKIACVHEDAVLAFHGPTLNKRFENNDHVRSTITKTLADHYPKPLREWFYKNAADLSGNEYITMTGKQSSVYGVKLCL